MTEEIEISWKSPRPPTVRKTPPEVNIDELEIEGDNLMKFKPEFVLNDRKEKTTKIAKLRKRKEDEKVKVVHLRDVSPHFDAH